MFIGPILAREAVTAPRRPRHYVARATYVGALLVLMCTAWLVLSGSQEIRTLGDLSRFGVFLFQLLSPLQLILALYVSAISVAMAVAREKDRGTLVLLLTTDLSNRELVLGRLAASLLTVLMLLFASLPLFFAMTLLGGVEIAQVLGMFCVTVAAAVAAGSVGGMLAFWREKTFQSLALTLLVVTMWLGTWEAAVLVAGEEVVAGRSVAAWAAVLSPWQALAVATRPFAEDAGGSLFGRLPGLPGGGFIAFAGLVVLLTSGLATWRVRRWNPSRAVRPTAADPDRLDPDRRDGHDEDAEAWARRGAAGAEATSAAAPLPSRPIWNNPVAWREIRTRAYGRRVLLVRLVYVVLFALAAAAILSVDRLTLDAGTWTLLPMLFFVSLVLINAQAVTSLSTERDGRTLDLLLATELTPKQIIFGKLGGVLFNTLEMVVLPLLLCGALWQVGLLSGESAIFLCGGLVVLDFFVAVLGVHCGLIHEQTRVAMGTSLGTVFFLFLGVAICMRIMVAFQGSFESQLAPFLAFILGGGVGLYISLGARHASRALFWASFLCPFLTFWAITSFFQQQTLGVFLVTTVAYGFATLAMLIPALSEFDVASGQSEKV
ncbi:MAG: hypothetical protein DWQ31_01960 [Planctomycetota bacterium]|nr:MAG: hypothetical protein DWQ31_01960 [Planctomycetota bacterium]REJ95420.1 MAG: hypothetical protein DWQ35_06760 [Planctomycetota bacterium]